MVANNDSAMEITGKEFFEVINSDSKLVVVDFFAEWCMPCVMLGPVIEELASSMKGVKFTKVNIDENSEIANKYGVNSIPCLIIFKNGEEVDRIVGLQSQEFIEEKIEGLMEE